MRLHILRHCLFFCITLLCVQICYSQPGSLDPSFSGGFVITDIGESASSVHSIVLQKDGKIIVTGRTFSKSSVLIRYLENGTIDSSFGKNGIVLFTFDSTDTYIASASILQNNRILVAGSTPEYNENTQQRGNNFFVARYLSNGDLDSTFGNNGRLHTPITSPQTHGYWGQSLLVQTDEKFIISGEHSGASRNGVIIRYNYDGTIDSSFGNNGIVDCKGEDNFHLSLQLPGGKLLFGGSNNNPILLMRLLGNGKIDTSFSKDGYYSFFSLAPGASYNNSSFSDFAIDANGSIFVASTVDTNPIFGGKPDFGIGKIKPSGGLDTSFGTQGAVITDLASKYESVFSLVVQPDGKPIVIGTSGGSCALIRFLPNGTVDSSFGSNGIALNYYRWYIEQYGGQPSVLQQDNKVVVAGIHVDSNQNYTIAVARYLLGEYSNVSQTVSPKKNISLYPQPANDMIHFGELESSGRYMVKVYDMLGKKCIDIESEVPSANISQLTPGYYFLHVRTSSQTYSSPFIKK
jgi:uncharacterized delta-60 repeat protein